MGMSKTKSRRLFLNNYFRDYMRSKFLILVMVLFLTLPSFAQHYAKVWEKLNYLVGNWEGDASNTSNGGAGGFTFKYDLDKNILVRRGHSEDPSPKEPNEGSGFIHNDLMIIYRDSTGKPNKAIYFDNESHVINYTITFPNGKEIVFTSDKISGTPRFRLTYKIIDDVTVDTIFDISKDGEHFFAYIQGKSIRVK